MLRDIPADTIIIYFKYEVRENKVGLDIYYTSVVIEVVAAVSWS
jgi:hypothetical protein